MPGKLTIGGRVALLIVGRQDLIEASKAKKAPDISYEDLRHLIRKVFSVAERVEFRDHAGIRVLKDRFMGRQN